MFCHYRIDSLDNYQEQSRVQVVRLDRWKSILPVNTNSIDNIPTNSKFMCVLLVICDVYGLGRSANWQKK
jgi:hypothetical protein